MSDSIIDVCTAIFEEMGPVYLKNQPLVQSGGLQRIIFMKCGTYQTFWALLMEKGLFWNSPSTHVSKYRDYKCHDSITLMAVVGPDYRIIHADAEMNGRMSNVGNWSRNAFRKAIGDSNNPLDIPCKATANEIQTHTSCFSWR